jgi:hypothetical protein
VVWHSNVSPGTDTDSRSIHARRYDASGSPIGGQFQVNSYTTGGQSFSAVASDSSGNFVVVWQSNGSAGDAYRSVQGQRFSSTGSAIGGEFQVNTYTTDKQAYPAVASDPAGNFLVVWDSYGSVGSDTSGLSVEGQRYDASGSPVGGQFQVNTYTTSHQGGASAASDASGDFVVVWSSLGSAGSDTSIGSIQGQRYDASGAPIGGEFQVNTHTISNQSFADVSSDAAGNFVVVWRSQGGAAFGMHSVHGQRYDTSGAPVGAQFQVNTYTTIHQYAPSVASDSSDHFVVVWQSEGSPGNDTSGWSVQGQLPEPSFGSSLGAMIAMLVALARRRRSYEPSR